MMRDRSVAPGVLLLASLLVAACAQPDDTAGTAGQATLPEGHPDIAAAPSQAVMTGTVKETLEGGGYTYALLDDGDREVWVAGPTTELSVGQEVALPSAMAMGKFTSKSLDRTFDELYFTDAFLDPGEVVASPQGEMPAAAAEQTAANYTGTVVEAINAAGYTYINVDVDGEKVWLAAPQTPLAEGATVSWRGGMAMRNFASKTLDRTFEEILFVDAVQVASDS